MINRGCFALSAKGVPEYSARAVDLVQRSTVIDMLGLLTLDYRKMSAWQVQPERFQTADFERLKNSGITVFYPAVGYTAGDIYTETSRDIMGWNTFLAARPQEFLRVDSVADFERAKSLGKIGILIGQQNSVHFRSLEDVDYFYRVGQRVSQLAYTGNRIGGGSSDAHDAGLSQYGAQVV
jgi:membrane dipeptidase